MDFSDHAPNLLVAGVTKTGTTSLYWYLTQHEEICPPRGRKEIEFFTPMRSGQPPMGTVSAYGSYFAACAGEKYRLDASPRYFDGGRDLVKTVREYAPDARIIMVFRDPVSRAWSQFRAMKAKGKISTNLSFREYFEGGMESYASARSGPEGLNVYRGVALGRYSDFLRDWFDVFGDRVLVLFYEHLVHEPSAVVARTCSWLGLDPEPAKTFDYSVRNRTVDPRSIRLSKAAYTVNFHVSPVLNRFSTSKAALRSAYSIINRRRQGEELADRDRRMGEEYYLPTNKALHAELSQRGYTDFPTWLTSSVGTV